MGASWLRKNPGKEWSIVIIYCVGGCGWGSGGAVLLQRNKTWEVCVCVCLCCVFVMYVCVL